MSVTVNSAFAGYSETIAVISIDKSREVIDGLSLKAGFNNLVIGNRVATFQTSAFYKVEMSARLEKQRSGQIDTFRNHNNTAAICSSKVNHFLDSLGLNH